MKYTCSCGQAFIDPECFAIHWQECMYSSTRFQNLYWKHVAYAKLGCIRDELDKEHVKIIQDFIG